MRLLTYLLLFTLVFFSLNSFAQYSPEDFAKDFSYLSVKVSPDGKHLAARIMHEGKRQLAVFKTADKSLVGGAKFPREEEVGNIYWANNERLVIEILQSRPWLEEPQFYGQLYAVDLDGTNGELIYGYNAGETQTGSMIKKKQSTFGWGQIVSILPDDEDNILIASTPLSVAGERERKASFHTLNVNTGIMSRPFTRSPVAYAHFVADQQGQLRFATGVDESNDKRTYRYENDEWHEVSAQFGEGFFPLSFDESGETLFYLDDLNQDLLGIFSVSLKTGEKSEIYTDDKVDISHVVYNAEGNSIYAARLDPDYPEYVMLNAASAEAQLYKQLLQAFRGYEVTITSQSDDGRFTVIYTSNDVMAGNFYLYDKKKKGLIPLFANMSHLSAKQLASSEPFTFEASDGLQIHGYLTLPVNAEKPVPLVTLVHGGPHGVRDIWAFDREVQMLASQGYGVLRVNYRGSGGYGNAFEEAGYREWGSRVVKDIIEGTQWAMSQPEVDQKRTCIMGGSFGGYAALQASTVSPDVFKCAVGVVGVYNLPMMYEEGDIPDRLFGKSFLEEVIGTDEEQLKAFSPTENVERLQAAVMIIHNEEDRRVPIEQAKALKEAMDKAGKKYEWYVTDNESHGFYNAENRQAYFQRVSQFLQQHLSE